ncbi:hypothetical protein JCM11641_000789 [Rhodosporidiobolus odoratus]
MSGPTATEQASGSLPGGQNLHHEKEGALTRAYNYPVVHDTLLYADSYLTSHSLTSPLYQRVYALTQSILSRLEPLQKRFQGPLASADGYANATLDFIEKRVPQVKLETKELVGRARGPADQAYERAVGVKDGIQQQVNQRLQQGLDTLAHAQGRLASAVKNGKDAVPTDQASLNATLENLQNELDGLVKATKAIPANAQATAKPVIDGFIEAATDVRKELARSDINLTAKANNVLSYSQDRLQPVLEKAKAYLSGAKQKTKEQVNEAQN